MIQIKNLHKSYKIGSSSLHVLKGINFNVEEGELVAIMGSSGSGKSTLLNILGMLDSADDGEYILDQVPIKDLNETKAATSSTTWTYNLDISSWNLRTISPFVTPIAATSKCLLVSRATAL